VRLVARRPLTTEGIAAFVDSALAELQAVGLDLEMADRVLGVVASFTLGHVSEEVGDEVRAEADASRPQRDAIDATRFPLLARVGEMKPTDYDREFDLGIDFIVAGLERLLAQQADGASGSASTDPRGYDKIIG